MNLHFSFNKSEVILEGAKEKRGILARFLPRKTADFEHLGLEERRLAMAVADLRALAEELDEPLTITADQIRLSHRLAAAVDSSNAQLLGLPGLTDYVLETDVQGVLGSPDFRLTARWLLNGQPRSPKRTGAFIGGEGQEKRIPLWMLDALAVCDRQDSSGDDARHWESLARFRKALEPGIEMRGDSEDARISMSDFLQNLRVQLADQFSIAPNETGTDFEVLPFSSDRQNASDLPAVAAAELSGSDLRNFQQKLRERGALKAFRLDRHRFMVVDPSAMPVLKLMARMQKAPPEERRSFMQNPRAEISRTIEAQLLQSDDYCSLDPAQQQEVLEAKAQPLFVETEEFAAFSARVTGVEVYRGNPLAEFNPSGTVWYPETFPPALVQTLQEMDVQQLTDLTATVSDAIESRQPTVQVGEFDLPANSSTVALLSAHIAKKSGASQDATEPSNDQPHGPVVLKTATNFEDLTWAAQLDRREPAITVSVPTSIRTSLKHHQVESFNWQVEAWKSGLPGVLNADEPGLGKTLQTISFLVWLNEHMKLSDLRGPVLVVAPTSLLRNWEEEVDRHVERPGLGHLIRLYGSATGARRQVGLEGRDIDDGIGKLDLSDVISSLQHGNGHLTWVLTTYQTLTNYQHSLARIPFAAAVFDEIQEIKNPGTLAAHALRAMRADFRIGLTGTPIENATVDLWAIMDQLAPGALGSLREFRAAYGTPDAENMKELHSRVFMPQGSIPALAIRRLKSTVARDLAQKTRLLHPRLMPAIQCERYDEARLKLAQGGMGAALKMLQHIRGVSIHPEIEARTVNADFISASARLSAVFDILRAIKGRNERALIFIEHHKMQYRFIELAKAELGLAKIDMINGNTPIRQRQDIVNRFQKNLEGSPTFDLLVLGPKAAGTGLTLTAATHVIHLSRWWNPAVEEQCNDRVHRIGQRHPVTVHVPVAIHPKWRESSFDLLLQSLMQRKRQMANAALWPMGEAGGEVQDLQRMISQQESSASGHDPVEAAMLALFERDQTEPLARNPDGSWSYA